jgi:predicted enzyme related to lactoylglutathione lyase
MGRTVLVMAIGSLHELVFDCSNPEALARFWQALIGGEVEVESADWAVLDGDELGQRVPERKTAKNRLHLDVEVPNLDSAVDNAELLGAGTIGARVNEDGGSFQVMADPGGNEFCFITSG